MINIKVKSPTRIDLSGGTLDMWPLYSFLGGALTINVAINIYTYAELIPLQGKKIIIESKDLGLKGEFSDIDDCLNDRSGQFNLFQSQIRYWRPEKGFHLITNSESPVGGGLGGSSSLTVSLLKAFAQFCGRRFKDINTLVHVAHNLEAELLNTPTGTQDYYPAITGGMNFIHYSHDGIRHELLSTQIDSWNEHSILVYTGKSHHSGLNNFDVLKAAVAQDPVTMRSLREIKDISREMGHVLKNGQWNLLPSLFQREYVARVALSPSFTSPEIAKLAQIGSQSGADGIKICGAGGGGCVMLWAQKGQRASVVESCIQNGFTVLNAIPVGRDEFK